MRVCGVADAWIFCGFSRDARIYPWKRPYPANKAKAKNGPLRRIRWDERQETMGNVRSCLARKIPLRVRRTGRFDAGNPYYQDSELRRSSDW